MGCSKEPTFESDSKHTPVTIDSEAIGQQLTGTPNSTRYVSPSLSGRVPNRSDTRKSPGYERSASQLLDDFMMLMINDGPMQIAEIARLRVALHGLGYDTLKAIKSLMIAESMETAAWESSREQALLEILLILELPEVEAMALEWLSNNPSPMAVVQIGRYLERRATGAYDLRIRRAAEQALLAADQSDESLGPLFQLLGEYGDENTVALLLDMPGHKEAYASVALAMIPNGSGIALLEQDARLVESGLQTVHGRLAIELLAQQAHLFDEAAAIVLDLAAQGLIPTDIWPRVIAIVSGERQITLNPPVQGLADSHTIFGSDGNQTLYLVAMTAHQNHGDFTYQRDLMLEELLQLAPWSDGL